MRVPFLFILFPFFCFGNRNQITVSLQFLNTSKTIKIDTFSVQPEFKFSVARTGVSDSLEKTPAHKKIPGIFKFTNSEKSVSFVLVAENKTDHVKYFFATPHHYLPPEFSLTAIFECLCNSHVYKIPPHKIWYRVVRLEVDPNIVKSDVSKYSIVHSVVEVSEKDAKNKYREMHYEQL